MCKSVPHEIAEERNWERIIPSASLERGKVRCLRQNVSLNHISCYFSCQHCVSSWKVGVWNEALDLWIIESTRYSDQFQLVSLDRSFFFFFFLFIFFLLTRWLLHSKVWDSRQNKSRAFEQGQWSENCPENAEKPSMQKNNQTTFPILPVKERASKT